MRSERLGLPIVITLHAAQRTSQRSISVDVLMQIMESGTMKFKGDSHLWMWSEIPGRADNLLCLALVVESEVIVKTVLNHWKPTP